MKVFWTLAILLSAAAVASPEALNLLQQPPADTYADEGMNAAGWGNLLWAAIAVVALVMFVALAMLGLRSTKRSRIGD